MERNMREAKPRMLGGASAEIPLKFREVLFEFEADVMQS